MDVFDIDKFFKEIERQIDSLTDHGAYAFNPDKSNTVNQITEDEKYIYITTDIKIEPGKIDARIEKETQLIVLIDTTYIILNLPSPAEKIECITCINGILDIKIRKK
jgi:hypothetical protein